MNVHWYDAASPEQRREYDAFGPWVLEVTAEADRPPVFHDQKADFDGASLVIKFPIDRDRRDCRPGQVLYPAVWILRSDRFVRLRWDGHKVLRDECPLAEIAGVDRTTVLLRTDASVNLLDGRRWTQVFSTGSKSVVDTFFDRMLAPLKGADQSPLPATSRKVGALEPDDAWYASVARAVQAADPDARVALFEEPGQPFRDPKGRKRRSQGLLLVVTGREIQLHDRGVPGWKTSATQYAGRSVRIPRSRWEGFEEGPDGFRLRAGLARWVWTPVGQMPAI